MPAITVAMRTEISQLYVSLFGRAPDGEGLGFWVSSYANGNSIAKIAQSMYEVPAARAYYPLFATPTEVVTTFYTNVLGRAPDTEGLAFWVKEYNNLSQGAFFEKLISTVVNYSGTDAAGVASKSLFVNKVAVAQYYGEQNGTVAGATAALNGVTSAAASVDAAKAVILNTAVSGQTFTLTTSLESLTGTAGNDAFIAPNATNTAVNATMTTGDTINGGAGVDTLSISGSVALSTVSLANVSAVEKIVINDATGVTVALAGSSGVTNVTSNASTTATTFTGIASTSVGLGVSNSAVGATFTFATAAVAGLADTATLTLSGQTAGTNVIAGVETLNIVSSGSANAVTALTTDNATKYVISGDQTLDLGTLAATVFTVDAAAATAGVTFTAPNNATAMTITGGSGNDAITMTGGTAVNDSIDAGAGNDTVTFLANLANTDTVKGGDGVDTLVGTTALLAGLTIATANTPIITGFENVTSSDDLGAITLTLGNIQAGVEKFTMAVAQATNQTIVFGAGAKTVTQTAQQGAVTLTTTDTGTAITDSMTFNIAAATAAVDVLNTAYVVNGFETVNFVTTTAGTLTKTTQTPTTITVTPDTGGSVTINFSGDNSVSTGVITATSATAGVINASGLTGTRTFTNAGATVGITSITGSANADTIVGSATATTIDGGAGIDNITGGVAADSIFGGAGNDVISGAGGNDTLSGGDGNDSITQGVAGITTVIEGGAGADTITLSGMLASGQKIDGGDGTDTLVIATADIATLAGLSFAANTTFINNLKNVERVNISNAMTTDLDMSRLGTSINYVQMAADNGGGDSVTGMSEGATVETLIAQTASTTFALATATGTNDTINLIYTGATGVGAATYGATTTGIENVNITHNDADTTASGATADAAATITLLDVTAKNITLAGNGLSTTLTLTSNVNVTSISSASYAGAMTVTSVSTVASTITGGAGADVITGGTKADSIFGGAGSDTLVGGLGADTLDGGTGTNTLDASGMTAVTDAGNTTSSGAIINLGATAISSADVTAHLVPGGTAISFISGALSEIGAGKAGYLFATNAAGASSQIDTISNFTKITGTAGDDYIVGNAAGAQTITGGTGADYMVGGSGIDTFVQAAGASVVSDSGTVTAGGVATGDTIGFGNGVDVIAGFNSASDVLDLVVATAITGNGVAAAATLAAQNYLISGSYNETTGLFTVNTTTGADTLIIKVAADQAVFTAVGNTTNSIVLIGVSSVSAAAITALDTAII